MEYIVNTPYGVTVDKNNVEDGTALLITYNRIGFKPVSYKVTVKSAGTRLYTVNGDTITLKSAEEAGITFTATDNICECKCGAQVPDDISYCPHCGELLPQKTAKIIVDKQKLSSWNYRAERLASIMRLGSRRYPNVERVLCDEFIKEIQKTKQKADRYDNIGCLFVLVFCIAIIVVPIFLIIISELSKSGLEIVKDESTWKYGLYDHDNDSLVVPQEYDWIIPDSSNGVYYLFRKEKVGVADHSGKITIPCKMDSMRPVGNGMSILYKNGMQGVCSWKGQIIIPSENQYVFWEKKPTEWTWEIPADYVGNIIPVKRSTNGGWDIYDKSGNRISLTSYQEAVQTRMPDIIKVKHDDLYGLIDVNGNQIISCSAKRISYFFEEKAFVNYALKEDIIDSQGQVLSSMNYEYKTHWHFQEGLFAKEDNEGYIGFYNEKGELVIKHKFKQAREGNNLLSPCFHGDSARISYQGSNGYVYKNGTIKLDATN